MWDVESFIHSKNSADHACAVIMQALLQQPLLIIRDRVASGMSRAKQGVTVTFDSWTDFSHN
jgi:hypothetical protein